MFDNLKAIVKNAFTETEQERLAREERENKINTQKTIIEKINCPICNGKSFDKGYIRVSGTYAVAVEGISTYHDSYNSKYEDLVRVCTTCGYVLLFADFKTQEKIRK